MKSVFVPGLEPASRRRPPQRRRAQAIEAPRQRALSRHDACVDAPDGRRARAASGDRRGRARGRGARDVAHAGRARRRALRRRTPARARRSAKSLIPAGIPPLRRLGIEDAVAAIGMAKPGATLTVVADASLRVSFANATGDGWCRTPTTCRATRVRSGAARSRAVAVGGAARDHARDGAGATAAADARSSRSHADCRRRRPAGLAPRPRRRRARAARARRRATARHPAPRPVRGTTSPTSRTSRSYAWRRRSLDRC